MRTHNMSVVEARKSVAWLLVLFVLSPAETTAADRRDAANAALRGLSSRPRVPEIARFAPPGPLRPMTGVARRPYEFPSSISNRARLFGNAARYLKRADRTPEPEPPHDGPQFRAWYPWEKPKDFSPIVRPTWKDFADALHDPKSSLYEGDRQTAKVPQQQDERKIKHAAPFSTPSRPLSAPDHFIGQNAMDAGRRVLQENLARERVEAAIEANQHRSSTEQRWIEEIRIGAEQYRGGR